MSQHIEEGEPRFAPLTVERWPDLEALFGPRGACGGCWDMYWRVPGAEFDRNKGEGNRQAFRTLIESGITPGVLGYVGDKPAGWCAVQPRETYPRLARSRSLKPVDDAPVWSVTCFFVARAHRRSGLSVGLLRAVVEHAAGCGARIVEGYPVDPRGGSMPDAFAWYGTLPTFLRAGFVEVARPSPTRAIMRYVIREG